MSSTTQATTARRAWRRWALVVLLALGGGAAGWWGYRQYQLDQRWQAAQAALERHDCWLAQEDLKPCLVAWPDRLDVRLLAARAARLADALDEAEAQVAWCERAAQTAPEHAADVRFERMLLQVQQGDLKPYEVQTQRWPRLLPPNKILLLDALARGFAETYHVSDALQCLREIDEIEPEYVPALLLQSQLHMRYKRHEEALGPLEKAVAVVPDALPPRLQLAECLMSLGRPRDAVVHLEWLRQRRPAHAEVLLAMARCRIYRNQLDDARQMLDGLLVIHPRHVEALIERGRLEFRVGDLAQAAAWLRRALDVHPDHIVAWRLLEATTQAQGLADDHERAQAKVEQLDHDMGQLQRQELRLTQELRPAANDLFELGERWRSLHNDREAQKSYAGALQQDANHRPTHRALAALFAQTGQPHRAARHRALADAAAETDR